jgi:hypothetical protein
MSIETSAFHRDVVLKNTEKIYSLWKDRDMDVESQAGNLRKDRKLWQQKK